MMPANAHQSPIRWVLLSLAVVLTSMELLDTTVVALSLPYMRGDFSANMNQISWVMSAYLLGLAIIVPLTGFLTRLLGRRNLLLIAVSGFGLFSIGCGFANNLLEIVFFSLLQGMFGALLAPLGQALINENFSKQEYSKAMSYYGIGVMAAPIFGPILGGFLTQYVSWRWDYLINVPVCISGIILILRYVQQSKLQARDIVVDWLGMSLLAIGLGSLQFVLSQGAEDNWFNSNIIIFFTGLGLISVVIFVVRGIIIKEKNIVNFQIYKDANFTIGNILMIFFRLSIMSVFTWVPSFLQEFLGYVPLSAGMVMVPMGIISIISLLAVPYLMRYIKSTYLIACGFLLMVFCGWFLSKLNLGVDEHFFQLTFIAIGIASGFFYVPTMRMTYATLPAQHNDEAAGLLNFSRAISGSLGVSITSTIITMQTQVNWHWLGGKINPYNPNLHWWLQAHHMSLTDPQTAPLLGQQLLKVASANAYADSFHFGMILCMLILPLIFLFRGSRQQAI